MKHIICVLTAMTLWGLSPGSASAHHYRYGGYYPPVEYGGPVPWESSTYWGTPMRWHNIHYAYGPGPYRYHWVSHRHRSRRW